MARGSVCYKSFLAGKMLKSLAFLVLDRIGYSQKIICSSSLVRFVYDRKYGSASVDDEDKKEQFSGPIPIELLKIKYSRSPGPGGQNVNKVNTKVDIRFHIMTAQWIPHWIREKLYTKEVNRINKEGDLVVQSNRFRNQQKNLNDGVQKVREILENVSCIPKETSEEKKAKIVELIKTDHKRRLLEKKFRTQTKQERSRNE